MGGSALGSGGAGVGCGEESGVSGGSSGRGGAEEGSTEWVVQPWGWAMGARARGEGTVEQT